MITRASKVVLCYFGVPNCQKGSTWANMVLKTMKKREIDNIDPNKAFYLFKLQQAALILKKLNLG